MITYNNGYFELDGPYKKIPVKDISFCETSGAFLLLFQNNAKQSIWYEAIPANYEVTDDAGNFLDGITAVNYLKQTITACCGATIPDVVGGTFRQEEARSGFDVIVAPGTVRKIVIVPRTSAITYSLNDGFTSLIYQAPLTIEFPNGQIIDEEIRIMGATGNVNVITYS
jgi:hypothetical protein